MAKKKQVKIGRAVLSALSTVLTAVVVLVAVALVGVRLFGLTPYSILSGSMVPEYNVGDLIYVKKTAPESIKVGDPITFVLNENLVVVTHRVVEIDAENQRFTTKGDANETVDGGRVHFKNLIGKPVFSLPYMGYISNCFSTATGKLIGAGVILAVLLLLLLPGSRKNKEELQETEETPQNAVLQKKE